MQTQKEILRDNILMQMRQHLDTVTLDILNQVLVQAMFNIQIVAMETLPATLENSNEYIMELFRARKGPKLSKKTVNYYMESIQHLCDFCKKSLLRMESMDIENYLNFYHRKGNGAVAVNNERRNISAVYTWMRKSKLVTENPCENIEKYVEIEKPIDHLEDWEMEMLRDACKKKVVNKVTNIEEYREMLRDRAMLEFLRSTAVRVGECVSVNISDINWNTGGVLVYGEKGRAYRTVYLDDVAKYHVKKYIDSRKDRNQALFVSVKGKHERMQTCGIRSAVATIGRRAGIVRKVYPHLFRKTTATNMAKRGCQREMIAFYLEHKNGNTNTLNKHYAATSSEQIAQAFWQYGAAA